MNKMSSKTTWMAIAAVILVLLVAGVIYWQAQKSGEEDALTGEQKQLEDLNRALEAATKIEVPSANPLRQVLPENPLEKPNPFSDQYQNPFE